jgi:hypothetical protein
MGIGMGIGAAPQPICGIGMGIGAAPQPP